MTSLWQRAAEAWPRCIEGLSAEDAHAAGEALLFLMLPVLGEREVPRDVCVAAGRLLGRAGVTADHEDPNEALASWFESHPLSPAARAAIEEWIAGLPDDVHVQLRGRSTDVLGVKPSSVPVGGETPRGSVRGPMALKLSSVPPKGRSKT